MKKLPVYLTTLLLLVFFSFACRRNDMAIKKETLNFSVDQAKAWFTLNLTNNESSSIPKTHARIINGLPDNKKTLLWKFAIQKKNKQVEGVEVPYVGTNMVFELPDSSYKNNSERDAILKGISKRAVIYKKPNGTVEIILVQIVPSYSYLLSHPNHFKDNYFLNLDKDFTGWIYTYNWNDNPKSISEIKNGKLLKGKTRIVSDSSATQTNNRNEYICFQNCSPVYIGSVGANCGNPGDQYYDDCVYNSQYATGNWINSCRWECGYIWIPDSPGDGGGGGGGGGTPPDDCNYYGTCTQSDEEVVDDITSNLSNPCFQQTVNTINNANSLGTDIGFILHECFTFWQPKDLYISQICLSNPDTDGHTFSGTYEIIIKFNECALQNASQEYIAATLYHEILHAYFIADGRNIDDHQEMATRYLNAMISTLKENFSSLNPVDAKALAWGGLQKTKAWSDFQQADLGTTLDILNTNKKYKRGEKGTACPPVPPPPPPSGGGGPEQ